jgi:hypothetical protein
VLAATASALLALAAGVGACGSGAQCALDSDCALGLRCNASNQCVPRGAGDVDAAIDPADAGPRTDAGLGSDAGPATDAARDAFDAVDAGELADGDTCPMLAASYMVTRVGVGCSSGASRIFFMRGAGACSYDVSSDARNDVEGTVTLDMGTLRGGLSFPDVSRICTVDVFAAEATIGCSGGCNIELTAIMP